MEGVRNGVSGRHLNVQKLKIVGKQYISWTFWWQEHFKTSVKDLNVALG